MELVLDKVSQKNVNLPIKQNQFISIKLYEYFCRCFLRADSRLASLLEEMRLRADLPPSDGQRPDRRTLFGHAQTSSSSGTDGFNKFHLIILQLVFLIRNRLLCLLVFLRKKLLNWINFEIQIKIGLLTVEQCIQLRNYIMELELE